MADTEKMTLDQQRAIAMANARIRAQQQSSGIPAPRRQWEDIPGEALANLPSSAGKFIGGMRSGRAHV